MTHNLEYDSFIFTHIPKCGGSSLRKLVYDSAIASGLTNDLLHIPGEGGVGHDKNIKQLDDEEYRSLKAKKIKVLADHSKLDFDLYGELGMKNPFIITVFRAPFERFLSHYNFFYKKVGHGKLKGKNIQSLKPAQLEAIIKSQANVMTAYLLNEEPGVKNTPLFLSKMSEIENIIRSNINVFGTLDDVESCIQTIGLKKPNWLMWQSQLSQINTNKYQPDFPGIKKVRQLFVKYNTLDIKLYQYVKALKNLRSLTINND